MIPNGILGNPRGRLGRMSPGAAPQNDIADRLADAVVYELNDVTQAWSRLFLIERVVPFASHAPWYKIEELALLRCAVVPLKIDRTRISRDRRQFDYEVAIDFQRIVDPKDEQFLRDLSACADQIQEYFDDGHTLKTMPRWASLKADRPDVYSFEQLYANKTWETLITLSLRGYRS